MSLITVEFEMLEEIHLGEITPEYNQPFILPGSLPKRISVETLQKYILLGIAEETLHVSTNLMYASYNIDTKRNASGAAVSAPGWACTDIFALDDSAGADFCIGGYGSIIQVFCYNIAGTFISSPTLSTITGGKSFSVPAGTKNISFNISDSGETTFPSLQLNAGSVLLAYEAPNYYFLKIKASAMVDYYTKTEVDAKINDIDILMSIIGFTYGKNILNPHAPEATIWIATDGTEGFIGTAFASVFIPVDPSTQYTLSGIEKDSGEAKNIAFYDENKELLSGATFTAAGSGTMANYTFTTGADVHYVKVQLAIDGEDYSVGQLEAGSSATSFETFTQTATTVNGVPTTFGSGGGGGGSTNLSFTRNGTTVTVASDTGTDAVLPAATTSLAGVMSAADKTKLDGVGAANLGNSANTTTVSITSSSGTGTTIAAATIAAAGVMTADDKKLLSFGSAKIVDWFDASDITGVSDGADLTTWTNKTGGNNAITTGLNKPNYIASANGMPAVNFTGASSESMSADMGAFQDLIMVLNSFDGAAFAAYSGIISKLTGSGGSDFALYADGAGSSTGLNTTAGTITVQGFASSNNEFGRLIKHKILRLSVPAGIAAQIMKIGGFWNIAGRYWNGHIQEIRTYSSVLTKQEFQTVFLELTKKYKLQYPTFLRTDGNSIMIGGYTGVTTAQSCGNLLNGYFQNYFNNKVDFLNTAVGGRTCAQSNAAALVPPGLDFQMDGRVINGFECIFLLTITNDIPGPGTGVTTYNDIMTFAANRIKKNESVKIFPISCISCNHTGGTPKIDEAERQIINGMLADFIPTENIIPLIITHADLDAVNACLNLTYYNADEIHPNSTGQALLAREVFKLALPHLI